MNSLSHNSVRLLFIASFFFVSLGNAEQRRFSPAQYAMLPALAVADLFLLEQEVPDPARWRGGVLFDDAVRSGLRLNSIDGRKIAAGIGDLTLLGLLVYPVLVDAVWDQWLDKGDGDSAGQLSLIATQAYLTTGMLRLLSRALAGRERPYQAECAANANYDTDCGKTESRASFFSGHASFSFTGAGLICAAHQSLDLKGGMAPCYIALGLATGVAMTRVMADKHYLTDTIVGMMVGLTSGYLIPRWLNYGTDSSEKTSVFAPAMFGDGIGFRYASYF